MKVDMVANKVHMVADMKVGMVRSEEHTSELQSLVNLVCRLLLEKKNCSLTPCRTTVS